MSDERAVAGEANGRREGRRMKAGSVGTRRRLAFLAVALLIVGLVGDGGRASTVPAAVNGQDPLEVLELKVRPNVIVVLDTSGSMTSTVTGTDTIAGDHPRSKLYQAKSVLRQIVQNNQDKVSFQMGTYTQNGFTLSNQSASTRGNRFQYTTSTMPATELTVQGASGDTLGRGLQSWQIIRPQWSRLYFGEGASTTTTAICYAEVSGTPRFFATGAALATELQARMNAATCTTGSRSNTYTVTYAAATGIFTFARATGTLRFAIRWADSPNSIRGALGRRSTNNGTLGTGSVASAAPYRLLYRVTGTGNSGGEMRTVWTFTENIGGTDTDFFQLAAGHLWNGETIRVQSNGVVCGVSGPILGATYPTTTGLTNPATLTLQLVATGCGADQTGSATFTFAGAGFGRSGDGCSGFRSKSSLVPCDLQTAPLGPAPSQYTQILPYIDLEFPFATTGAAADLTTNGAAIGSAGDSVPDGVPDYQEHLDGSWQVSTVTVAPSGKAAGYTPIANSLIDIKGTANAGDTSCVLNAAPTPGKLDWISPAATTGACPQRGFTELWHNGQGGTTNMAGPPPWQISPIKQHGTCPDGSNSCADSARKPKEKTIVIFVTDGDDTCGSRGDSNGGGADANARRAATAAEALYTPVDAADSASSVDTYVIGYGLSSTYLNWIAWGGSGLGQGTTTQPNVNWASDSSTTLTNARAKCSTCRDAFVAPDAATLATQLQSIIDQGASDGDFNAQQSITESVFEYVDLASDASRTYDARSPRTRLAAIVPTRFVSSFSLPGFKGQLRAYQNDGSGGSVLKWSAGQKLFDSISTPMATCATTAVGGAANQCAFAQLHAGASDATIATSAAKIKRRIYTTSRNGVFAFDPSTLMAGTATGRLALWPPGTLVAPADYTAQGALDKELGLPDDSATCTLVAPFTSCTSQWVSDLTTKFKACTGTSLPGGCTSSTALTKMKAARREAREMMLAFIAGAKPVPSSTGLARTSAASGAIPANAILYSAREWMLADSEMATAGVITPPNLDGPEATPYMAEYTLMTKGPRNASAKNPDTAGAQIPMGFGLTQPDDDNTVSGDATDSRSNLKPVMTVVYQPANDMLHAFRAGPNCSPSTSSCAESGGEELWGFLPYDQLISLRLRFLNEPQGRANHVFTMARGVRFADIFVPGAMTNVNIGGVTVGSMQGVWRRVLYFGRGIGGKYVTALDVTAPGAYTKTALAAAGPIPLWSRGNPDTADGTAAGTMNGTAADKSAYAKMGETWSIPTVAYVNKQRNNPFYATARSYQNVDFAIFMGSGYGATGEGTTHFTLDALSGDVIAAVDVEAAASTYGLTRSGLSYPNALVANSVSYNRVISQALKNTHPWAYESSRVYIGDVHGRVWKFLTTRPDVALPVADVGANQPIGTAVALIDSDPSSTATAGPYIFVTAGADRRASGPFRNFTFLDTGTDTDITVGASTTDDGVTTFAPITKKFARTFDQGDADASCGYATEAVFRGTVQPAGAFECSEAISNGKCPATATVLWRVFFAGTRLSPPNTTFAPATPLACGIGVYPCRSQFDTIIYALGVNSGSAAYDLNSSGDDAYRVFKNSRIAAISMLGDPDPNRAGSSFAADEGLMKGTPAPPPPPGVPPTAQTATANVLFVREPGAPAPAIRYGSTVCQ
ncbi:MAG: hypothetical protein U0599_04580 [Vicinamibacteria bacterium]